MNLPIDFEANPLIPAIIQDDATRDVLMLGFMNQLAFERTLETGYVHFWSRSRNKLWKKGETSGHTQEVVSMAINCEDNSLLVQVIQKGAVCHTGHTTCYYRQVLPDGSLFETSDPVFDPADIYAPDTERSRESSSSEIGTWYGAYEYLAQHPLQQVSGTSRLLHEKAQPFGRVADELEELAGALSGEHSHSGDPLKDSILEGSQVFYWLNVLAVGFQLAWDRDLNLAQVVATSGAATGQDSPVHDLRESTEKWRAFECQNLENVSAQDWVQVLRDTYRLVALAVAPVVQPIQLIRSDLRELRSKSYLADYFASTDV
jgi:phosphoribosyl-AMP cyclohydrolase